MKIMRKKMQQYWQMEVKQKKKKSTEAELGLQSSEQGTPTIDLFE